MADRYAYIPLIGIFTMFTWSAALLLQNRRISQISILMVAAVALVPLLFSLSRQIRYWSSSEQLWLHTLAVTSHNSLAHRQLGFALMLSNEPTQALGHFREAAAISPADPANYINLGLCLDVENENNAAIGQYEKAISLASDAETTCFCLHKRGSGLCCDGQLPKGSPELRSRCGIESWIV